ncbi:hypothetical protein V6N11_001459 [Hibiscus sabdariffa]|uniref:Uncharacterized protein n=1 Tax=Hibiscus sabdariffa TaxID=183260 RepID=A0ABR2S061_9ROSI
MDLDDTLYPLSIGFSLACHKNIKVAEFMLKYLDIEESEVARMCLELCMECGTTMAGLKALGFEFEKDEFHAYANGRLPYETLRPDSVLKNLLLSVQQRKIYIVKGDNNKFSRGLQGKAENSSIRRLSREHDYTMYVENIPQAMQWKGVCGIHLQDTMMLLTHTLQGSLAEVEENQEKRISLLGRKKLQ